MKLTESERSNKELKIRKSPINQVNIFKKNS